MNSIEDIKVAVVGNVNAAKSTLIGTLIRGKLDDGRGCNREFVMNYEHERQSGQTSSIGYQILGFTEQGKCINVEGKNRKDTWPIVMRDCQKLITFMDLAGHEKYLKTTIYGLSSNRPDYAAIMVEARGLKGMTKEHLMLCLSFDIPFFILLTKIDLYSTTMLHATIMQVEKLLKSAKRQIRLIESVDEVQQYLQGSIPSEVPTFAVSNVTGAGIEIFKEFLYKLPRRLDYSQYYSDPFEMAVLEGFMVPGIGTVAHGFIVRGTVKVGDTVWVGPDGIGGYHKSKIRTIQYKRIGVDFCLAGHHATVSLPGIDRKLLKQGVYIIHEKVEQRPAVRKFTASIKIFANHSTTIRRGYCPVLNIDNIRMSARILKIKENDYLRSGDKAEVQLKFLHRPAYVRLGDTFVFREGKTRGFGKVTSIDLEAGPGGTKPKRPKK